jgi:type I restriction enzyme M protein
MPKINRAVVESIPIRLPALATQRALVEGIQREQGLVDANRQLVAHFRKRIRETMERVWGHEQDAGRTPPTPLHQAR